MEVFSVLVLYYNRMGASADILENFMGACMCTTPAPGCTSLIFFGSDGLSSRYVDTPLDGFYHYRVDCVGGDPIFITFNRGGTWAGFWSF